MNQQKLFDLPDPQPGYDPDNRLLRPATPEQKKALNSAAYISAVLACIEAIAAVFTGSLALMAIAVDSVEDAAHYGLASFAAGKSRSIFLAGLAVLGVLALAAYIWIGWTAYSSLMGTPPPNPWIMMGVAGFSLIANLFCVWRLRSFRDEEGDFAFAWQETRWDFVADLGVILAAMAVSDWMTRWPDTTAGLIIAAVNIVGIMRIGISALRSRGE